MNVHWPVNRPLVAGVSISSVVFVLSTTCRIIVVACALERAVDCLCGRLHGQSVGSIQGGSDSLQIWMLILHGSSDIPMPHCPHHRREIAGVAQDPCPVIVPCAIQDEILRELRLPSCDAELLPQVRQMTTPGTSGRKQPSLRLTCGADPKHFVCPITHRDYSSPVQGLAVWHEDDSVVPVQVFRTDSIKLSPVPHPGVPGKDDDIPKQLEHRRFPIAGFSRGQ